MYIVANFCNIQKLHNFSDWILNGSVIRHVKSGRSDFLALCLEVSSEIHLIPPTVSHAVFLKPD